MILCIEAHCYGKGVKCCFTPLVDMLEHQSHTMTEVDRIPRKSPNIDKSPHDTNSSKQKYTSSSSMHFGTDEVGCL